MLRTFRPYIAAIGTLYCLWSASSAHTQTNDLHFDRISVEDGLSQSVVTSIVQDKPGFIWISTQDGLNRFDGYKVTVFRHDPLDSSSLAGNWINDLFLDSRKVLWVVLGVGGVDRLDPKTGGFRHYSHDPKNPGSLSHRLVTTVFEDSRGRLWFGTMDGLNLLVPGPGMENDAFVRYSPDEPEPLMVSSVAEDRSGNLWIGSARGGVLRLDPDGELTRIPFFPTTGTPAGEPGVTSVIVDDDGIIWAGTFRNGLYRSDPKSKRFSRHSLNLQERHTPTITRLFQDKARRLWVLLSSNHVIRLDESRTKVKKIPFPDPLSSPIVMFEDKQQRLWAGTTHGLTQFAGEQFVSVNQNDVSNSGGSRSSAVTTMFQDHSGILWIGSAGAGASKINDRKLRFRHFGSQSLELPEHGGKTINSIITDQTGSLWLGTSAGLYNVDRDGIIRSYTRGPGAQGSLNNNVVRSIARTSSGRLWIGTNYGLNLLDPATGRIKILLPNPLATVTGPANLINTVFIDSADTLWIGGSTGLYRLAPGTGDLKHYAPKPGDAASLPSSLVWAILRDSKGVLWVGTARGGLSRMRPDGSFVNYIHDPDDLTTLNNQTVTRIFEDRSGTLWIGTYSGGLSRFDPDLGTFVEFTETDGLAGNNITGILEDAEGHLWLSTNQGLSRFDPASGSFKNYDVSDGLQSNEFIRGACYQDSDGTMYFGGINGFNCFDPDSIMDNPHVPSVVITAFKVFDDEVALDPSGNKANGITLNYDQNFFSFEFVALDYTNSEKNQYAYKLEGFDRDWNYCGDRRYASYTNLDGGDYVFRVIGSNNDGVWNTEGASVKIRIQPPFWKTPVFYFLSALAGIALIAVIYNIRIRRAKKRITEIERIRAHEQIKRYREVERAKSEEREKVRKRIAADFHDESGHKLTKISLFSGVIESKIRTNGNVTDDVRDYLNRIIEVSTSLHNDISDFFWALDPDEDTLHDAAIKLKDFGEKMFEGTGIAFRVHGITREMESVPLPMVWRRHLTRIFKEAMNNVLKHARSRCQNVSLEFGTRNGSLLVSLVDDGPGFETQNGTSGRGLKNMASRSDRLNATIEVNSRKDGGTRIDFQAELPVQGIDSNPGGPRLE